MPPRSGKWQPETRPSSPVHRTRVEWRRLSHPYPSRTAERREATQVCSNRRSAPHRDALAAVVAAARRKRLRKRRTWFRGNPGADSTLGAIKPTSTAPGVPVGEGSKPAGNTWRAPESLLLQQRGPVPPMLKVCEGEAPPPDEDLEREAILANARALMLEAFWTFLITQKKRPAVGCDA